MEHRGASPLLLALALLSALCGRARALPPRAAAFPAAPRLVNRLPFDGASEPERARGSLKSESDTFQNTLPENEKFYLDLSKIIDRNARHADGLFTSLYSHLLARLALKRYLQSVNRKRVRSQDSPVKRHSDAVFTDNYSRFRKQMAVKKYLNSVLTGKRSQEELNPEKPQDEAELLGPSFSENYDDISVDELLSHLPLDL
ncbi:VIP peptides isoform X1 [Nothoprocta perdicaria]|uniref:VIP peptides isoform X1 n=1 Tax=Nothoprocta perdicaria TaxID=30464 RepID=UPI000E1B8E33|nr:VIP peptides isoform X1 [Nothoprocta perdicaria]